MISPQLITTLEKLPPDLQTEILHYAEYLATKHTSPPETLAPEKDLEPYETPNEQVIDGIRQGFHEAFTGQTIPLAQMWEGIDAE
jgi:hypothetical protein